MQLHQLKPKHKNRVKKRIGRGGKRGSYSGKGIKGQKSRAGRTTHPAIRELIKKYPKLRGYRFKRVSDKAFAVNIGTLDRFFKEGETVNSESLLKKGLVRKIKGRMIKVKILGKGDLKKKLIIENCEMSKSAKEKIEKVK